MLPPKIELLTSKPVVCTDATIDLDVLIRITPPQLEVEFKRPELNIALVLDRSGSMGGAKKMPYAIDAAVFVVEQLLPKDRVSVTIFDDQVETIVPSSLASTKSTMIPRIKAITPRGSTDLHGGWLAGAKQVKNHLVEQGLNRVLLLSDGLANVGKVDPATIATEARGMAALGVSTTTLGVGQDYNEDLMEAMATEGDGRYYFINDPAQLQDIFQTELLGLMSSLGKQVKLQLDQQGSATITEVLNTFKKDERGRFILPNLMVGMPIEIVFQLNVPALSSLAPLFKAVLYWTDAATGETHQIEAVLNALPAVPLAEWAQIPIEPLVHEQVVLLRVAKAQREAALAIGRGDYDGAMPMIFGAKMMAMAAPYRGEAMDDEIQQLESLEAAMDQGQWESTKKQAKMRAWRRGSGYGGDQNIGKPAKDPQKPSDPNAKS